MSIGDDPSISELACEAIMLAKAAAAGIVTAESCTAGALATILATTPDAGAVLQGGLIAYSKRCKTALLGIPAEMTEHSAVTGEVARAMAEGALRKCISADVSVAVTCVAGPEPDEDGNPVGLVFMAVALREAGVTTRSLHLEARPGGQVRGEVVKQCLELLCEALRARAAADARGAAAGAGMTASQ